MTEIIIPAGKEKFTGDLVIPENARGLVFFAHGSGSGRKSARNVYVSEVLQKSGIATLLFDLLAKEEERQAELTGHLRFNIPFLTERLVRVTDAMFSEKSVLGLNFGYFGASTGATVALAAAAELPDRIKAIVQQGNIRRPCC